MATDVGTTTGRQSRSGSPPDGSARTIRRRGGLPSARAIVGGFLIAVAGVGVFLAYTTATAAPTTRYVVAARDLVYGTTLAPGDLTTVAMELPAEQAARVFANPAELVGIMVVNPVETNELIQLSDLSAATGGGLYEVVIGVEPSRTLPNGYVAGEVVDVLATYGSGVDQTTIVVVRRALVLGDSLLDAGLSGGARVLRLGFDNPDQALAVTNAADAGTIGIVRATSAGDDEDGERTFRPDLSPGGQPGSVQTRPGDVPGLGSAPSGADGAPPPDDAEADEPDADDDEGEG